MRTNNVKKAIILDVAHGKYIKGKMSPEGKHQEWWWSRQTARRLMTQSLKANLPYDVLCPYLSYQYEPGLRARVDEYNEICKGYDETIMLSLHNNAAHSNSCDAEGWCRLARGIEFWTSKGETKADIYCTLIYNIFKELMPNEKYRTGYWLGEKEKIKDPDKEANFTVIAGYRKTSNIFIKPKYHGILLEIKFMTNRQDVVDLNNMVWLKLLDSILLECMNKIYEL